MHNWWIAALEEAGIWTREQAEHVSDHIKTTIHRDNYGQAGDELRAILSRGNFGVPTLKQVEAEVSALKGQVETLVSQLAAKVEGESKKVDKTPKA